MKKRILAIGTASMLIFSGVVPIKTVKAAEDINQHIRNFIWKYK